MTAGSIENTLLNGYAFLAFLYAGICGGILYDGFSLLREKLHRKAAGHLLDFLLVLCLGGLVWYVFFLVSGGALRLYGFCVILLGALLQRWVLRLPKWRICKRIVKRE